jgi:hypothetical protein
MSEFQVQITACRVGMREVSLTSLLIERAGLSQMPLRVKFWRWPHPSVVLGVRFAMSPRCALVFAAAFVVLGCLSFTGPSAVPVVDVVGRVTLPSGAPASGLTVTGLTYEPSSCGLPTTAREVPRTLALAGADGMYRMRVSADSAGRRCVVVYAQLAGGGPAADVAQVAEARTRGPIVVIKADLALR